MDNRGTTAAVGAWASLPHDLILEVFRRLESKAIIRCASTCRLWRRAIIGNAFFLRPRLDRFVPSLLLGVFHGYGDYNHQHVYLRRTPGPPFQSAHQSSAAGDGSSESRIQSLIPATGGGFDREMYTDLLSSRDGFVLLRGRRWWSGLCLLCNLITGCCKILPDATIRSCTYVLLTGYDDDLSSPSAGTRNAADQDMQAVRILAVAGTGTMCTKENRITYQVFSFMSGGDGAAGAWGPVKRSVELKTGFWVRVYDPCSVVSSSGDAVYWLGGAMGLGYRITCAVALDVRTGRTWTTELPAETHFWPRHQIQVWVLTGGDHQWSLQRTIDVQVQKLVPNHQHDGYFEYTCVLLNAFYPRSGCVIGRFAGQEIRIHLEGRGSSHPCVESRVDRYQRGILL